MSEEKKLGQEPAFAALSIDKSIKLDEQNTEYYLNGNNGMSKRFYAACAVMSALLSNPEFIADIEDATVGVFKSLSHISFMASDELLKKENE